MFESLKIKIIYDDFLNKVKLSQQQIEILNRLIKKETVVKISIETNMSERSVGYEIRKLKDLFIKYKQMEIAKANMLK